MADTAAHLVDRVFPEVPVRQWVLTLPVALRYRMAFDAGLTAEVHRAFIRTLFASLRRRARKHRKIRYAHAGAVTFVQRFGDGLNLNVHFHILALDGVFDADDAPRMRFIALAPPDDAEILRVLKGFTRRLARVLGRRGLGPATDADQADPLSLDEPLLAELSGASVLGRVATGPRAGEPARRLGDRIDVGSFNASKTPGCVSSGGITLHAAVAIPAHDRPRLERLVRYAARPPLATDRWSKRPDGRLVYRLRHRWRDGTTHMLFEPLELIERLAVLVPPPRFHLVRYAGLLAPRASWRDEVVPAPGPSVGTGHNRGNREPGPAPEPRSTSGGTSSEVSAGAPDEGTSGDTNSGPSHVRRIPWAHLLARVFLVDALACPRCRSRMRIIAAIQDPAAIRSILECLGLPTRPPPLTPAAPSAFTYADA